MFYSFTFWLIVLAMLIAYLCFSIAKRWRAEEAEWLAREREEQERRQALWRESPGEATGVSAIAPQIQRLRQDHRAALHTRPHAAFYRRGRIAGVRQMVTSLAYFHRPRPEQEVPQDDGSQN
jgi:hypothetical protein